MPASFATREEWLQAATQALREPVRITTGLEIPEVRIGVGFPRKGIRSNTRGECWSRSASQDGINEITVHLAVTDAPEALAILLHELCHAADDNVHKHGGPFRAAVQALGYEGPTKSYEVGADLRGKLATLADALGTYPSERGLDVTQPGSGGPKQAPRMIKCVCEACGFTFRTTRLWIKDHTLLDCPEPSCDGLVHVEPSQPDDSE